jgi:hypothetical protein
MRDDCSILSFAEDHTLQPDYQGDQPFYSDLDDDDDEDDEDYGDDSGSGHYIYDDDNNNSNNDLTNLFSGVTLGEVAFYCYKCTGVKEQSGCDLTSFSKTPDAYVTKCNGHCLNISSGILLVMV